MYFNQILNFKTLKVCFTLFMLAPFVLSCGSDDDAPPPVINEEEVITTVILTLTSNNGQEIVMTSQDLDGDGPNEPEITVSGNLSVATTYSGSVRLLNETVTPAENITDEVSAEGTEHQFFYTMGGGLNLIGNQRNPDHQPVRHAPGQRQDTEHGWMLPAHSAGKGEAKRERSDGSNAKSQHEPRMQNIAQIALDHGEEDGGRQTEVTDKTAQTTDGLGRKPASPNRDKAQSNQQIDG